MKIKQIAGTLILLLLAFNVFAQDIPEPRGFVNDYADMLSPSQQQQLEQKLQTYRDTTSNVVVISTVPSLQDYAVDEFALKMAESWDIWTGERFNGVLVLIAPNERKMRIEVGYGLEGAIPDALAGRIVNDILTPYFRKSDYYGGLDRATSVIMMAAAGEYEAVERATQSSGKDNNVASIVLFLLFIAFVIYYVNRGSKGDGKGGNGKGRRRRRTLGPGGIIIGGFGGGGGGFGSGGGGGGFGGFSGGGGFGFGGGGASGGW